MNITVELHKVDRWLDKQRELVNEDGRKVVVDAFRVLDMAGAKTVEILLLKWQVPEEWNGIPAYMLTPEEREMYMWKNGRCKKRVTYDSGSMIISICGVKYCIGTYKEV